MLPATENHHRTRGAPHDDNSMIRSISLLLVIAALLPPLPLKGEQAAWHHTPSPYRAVFKVTTHPSTRDGGYFIEVPVCGLGDADGQGVYAFDEAHRPLKMQALGPTRDNRALILVGREQQAQTIYAYWGSPRRAPRNLTMEGGLTLTLRRAAAEMSRDSWERLEKEVDAAPIIGVLPMKTIEVVENPLTRDTDIVYDFNGYLQAPRAQQFMAFLVHTGAGYVVLNGRPVIAEPKPLGLHQQRLGAGRQEFQLNEGMNRLRCVVVSPGERSIAVLARFENERRKFTVPAELFATSGATTLEQVESHYKTTICPAFQSEQPSYIGLEEVMLTEVALSTYTQDEVDWRLGNGARAQGAGCRTIHVGLEPLTVQAGQPRQREQAEGALHFAGIPPQWQWQNAAHYAHYVEIMLEQSLERLDPPTLRGYLAFMELKERHAAAAPVVEALLASRQSRQGSNETQLWQTLARATAADNPDRAAEAYEKLLGLTKEPRAIFEYIEFLLHRRGDGEAVEKVIERAERLLGRNERQLSLYRVELALLRNQRDAAMTALERLQTFITDRDKHRSFTVQGNAAIERFRDQLAAGYYSEAEAALRSVPLAAPETLLDGQYVLLRARHLRTIGWSEGAIDLIDALLAINRLPAFLPEIEMERAHALRDNGRPEEAKVLYRHIAETYPNHPVAAAARARLATP